MDFVAVFALWLPYKKNGMNVRRLNVGVNNKVVYGDDKFIRSFTAASHMFSSSSRIWSSMSTGFFLYSAAFSMASWNI